MSEQSLSQELRNKITGISDPYAEDEFNFFADRIAELEAKIKEIDTTQ